MTAYTYNITIPASSPTLPSGCGNAAMGQFNVNANANNGHVPINTTTNLRQFSAGDTITFAVNGLPPVPAGQTQTTNVALNYRLCGTGSFPFTSANNSTISSGMLEFKNVSTITGTISSSSDILTVPTSPSNSTIHIWFVITISYTVTTGSGTPSSTVTYYIADPEVQTGTGSA